MEEQEKESIKEMLLSMRKKIIEEIYENIKKRKYSYESDEIGDLYDLAAIERDKELSLLLHDRDREKLLEIDNALEKIKQGVYGICIECGDKISNGRLRIMPFTQLCVKCKSNIEKEKEIEMESERRGAYKDLSYQDINEDEY